MAEIIVPRCITVAELNHYLREYVAEDSFLRNIAIRGEIAGWKRHHTGTIYFTLKDKTCSLRAVMFNNRVPSLTWQPRDGEQVIALGQVAVYERDGICQLYVNRLLEDGQGQGSIARERLKRQLEAEGLFSPERKKPLPRYAQSVGVVTAPNSAAWADMKRILQNRMPSVELQIYPALVQGIQAPASLAAALAQADTANHEVLLLGRGGGAEEDLSAFDSEQVVRAVAACHTPVIAAIGHESDFSLADLAADVRAATPTHGATLAVPEQSQLLQKISLFEQGMEKALARRLQGALSRLEQAEARLDNGLRRGVLDRKNAALDKLEQQLDTGSRQFLLKQEQRLENLILRLQAMDPLATLGRGYSLVQKDGETISRAEQVNPGDKLEIRLSRGLIRAEVYEVEAHYGKSKTKL